MRALTDAERELVRQCLHAAVRGPFFPDWEFQLLFGLERDEVAAVLSSWPDLDDSLERDHLAINNALANLVGYPHGCEEQWPEFIAASRAEIARLLAKWRGDSPGNYFKALK